MTADEIAKMVGYGTLGAVALVLGVLSVFALRHCWLSAVFEARLYRSGIAHRKRDIPALYWYALTFDADNVSSDGRKAWFPGREWKD